MVFDGKALCQTFKLVTTLTDVIILTFEPELLKVQVKTKKEDQLFKVPYADPNEIRLEPPKDAALVAAVKLSTKDIEAFLKAEKENTSYVALKANAQDGTFVIQGVRDQEPGFLSIAKKDISVTRGTLQQHYNIVYFLDTLKNTLFKTCTLNVYEQGFLEVYADVTKTLQLRTWLAHTELTSD